MHFPFVTNTRRPHRKDANVTTIELDSEELNFRLGTTHSRCVHAQKVSSGCLTRSALKVAGNASGQPEIAKERSREPSHLVER